MSSDLNWLSFPDAPRIRVPPPGPRSRELLAAQGQLETDAVGYPKYFPIAISEARGATIEDADGNRFVDWMSGICVLNLGHQHPRLRAALDRQADRIWHALEIPTEARVEFLRELTRALPGTLRGRAKVFFSITGGDAVETAVNLAEFAKKRSGTLVFSGAYHGVHGGAATLTSGRKYHETSAFHGGRVVRVPYPDPYRSVLDPDGGTDGLFRYLEHLLSDPYSGVDSLASVLVEPILGEGGYVVPPDDFLPRLREFCDRHDLLLILDEVQTGLGRTGKMWACEHAGVSPDLLCVAKSIGGGIPLALVAYREDLVDSVPRSFHLGTFRANPLALALGAEVLKLLREEPWVDRAARLGPKIVERFLQVAHAHPSIGDVRGRGFMAGVEFVRSPTTKEPWGDRARAVRQALFARGVLMHTCGASDQVLRFMAPLIIEEPLLDRSLDVFEEAVVSLETPSAVPRSPRAAATRATGPDRWPEPLVPSPRPATPPPYPGPAVPRPGRNLP